MKKHPTVLELYDLTKWKELVKRKIVNPYSRRQPKLTAHHITPKKNDGYCDCLCGRKLKGRQSRWATKECSQSTYKLYDILQSQSKVIKPLLREQDGACCRSCGIMENTFVLGEVTDLEVDHILAICKGGGGLGLWNFQLLCKDCHKDKTKIDIQKPKRK